MKIKPWTIDSIACSQKYLPTIIMASGDTKVCLGPHYLLDGEVIRFRCTDRSCTAGHLFKVKPTAKVSSLKFDIQVNVPELYTRVPGGKNKKIKWAEGNSALFENGSFTHIQAVTPHKCEGRNYEFLNKLSVSSFVRIRISTDFGT